MSEPIELPSESTQEMRWSRNECILCTAPLPREANYGAQYCGAECRKAMTKLRRQRDAHNRIGVTQ